MEIIQVNKKNKIIQIKNEISEKEKQLEKLDFHAEKSIICSDLYNKIILEKAELNKQLQEYESDTILNKIKDIIPRKKTLICDYFHSK